MSSNRALIDSLELEKKRNDKLEKEVSYLKRKVKSMRTKMRKVKKVDRKLKSKIVNHDEDLINTLEEELELAYNELEEINAESKDQDEFMEFKLPNGEIKLIRKNKDIDEKEMKYA